MRARVININCNIIESVKISGKNILKECQRTAVNTECKLLLLEHAFDTLECNAVALETHHLNQRSQQSMLRLGAKQDGIMGTQDFCTNLYINSYNKRDVLTMLLRSSLMSVRYAKKKQSV